jgi:hypothetical protein
MFSHEKLIVHQKAIAFVAWTQPLIESLPKVSVRDQLDRASTSIPLNLAEGNVKFSTADRARYLQTHGAHSRRGRFGMKMRMKKMRKGCR